MKKCCVIGRCLSEENKGKMAATAAECGFDIDFYATVTEAAGKVSDAEVAYCNGPALFGEMPRLRWCHSMSAGVGHFLESNAFDSERITLTNSSGSYGLVISEYVIMTTLMLMRRIPKYEEVIDRREWTQNLPVRSIAGSSIAIIGTGDIGQNSAKRFKALGAEYVAGFSRSGRPAEGFDAVYRIDEFERVMACGAGKTTSVENIDAAAGGNEDPVAGGTGNAAAGGYGDTIAGGTGNAAAGGHEDTIVGGTGNAAAGGFDVLLLCVPGTPESEGLLSRERIALLSEKTFVINVGRGMVIDQDALIDALNEGRIAGAALDVVYPEPPAKDSPLWTAKNLILTPHISGDMGLPYTVDLTVDIFCDNLRRYARGQELTHVVDVTAGY